MQQCAGRYGKRSGFIDALVIARIDTDQHFTVCHIFNIKTAAGTSGGIIAGRAPGSVVGLALVGYGFVAAGNVDIGTVCKVVVSCAVIISVIIAILF